VIYCNLFHLNRLSDTNAALLNKKGNPHRVNGATNTNTTSSQQQSSRKKREIYNTFYSWR